MLANNITAIGLSAYCINGSIICSPMLKEENEKPNIPAVAKINITKAVLRTLSSKAYINPFHDNSRDIKPTTIPHKTAKAADSVGVTMPDIIPPRITKGTIKAGMDSIKVLNKYLKLK